MDDIVAARLDIVSAKAKILAQKYRSGQLWERELAEGLREIERELEQVKQGSGDYQRGGWGDR